MQLLVAGRFCYFRLRSSEVANGRAWAGSKLFVSDEGRSGEQCLPGRLALQVAGRRGLRSFRLWKKQLGKATLANGREEQEPIASIVCCNEHLNSPSEDRKKRRMSCNNIVRAKAAPSSERRAAVPASLASLKFRANRGDLGPQIYLLPQALV